MAEQREFSRSLADMLLRDGADAPSSSSRWNVYRNNFMRAALDALAANFPSVKQLVGDAFFDACAREYVLSHPPGEPRLLFYGAGFPDFLEEFEPAQRLAYLGDAARMDRWWTEAHTGRDALPWCSMQGLDLTEAELWNARLKPHPSLRFKVFDTTAPSVWLYCRAPEAYPDPVFEGRPEGVVIHRPFSEVRFRRLDPGEAAFLTLLREGAPLGEAGARALGAGWLASPRQIKKIVMEGFFMPPDTGG